MKNSKKKRWTTNPPIIISWLSYDFRGEAKKRNKAIYKWSVTPKKQAISTAMLR